MSDLQEGSAPEFDTSVQNEEVLDDQNQLESTTEEGEQDGSASPAEEEASKEPAKKPEKDWAQHRIDQLTRKRYEEVGRVQRELDAANRRAEELEARLNGTEVKQDPQDVMSLAERIAAERISQQTFTQRCNTAVEQGEREYGEEFSKALTNLQSLEALFEDGKPTELTNIVVESDNPAKLLHYLGTNKQEAARILALTPVQQARAIGALEVKLAAEKPQRSVSKAPEPISAVNAKAPATTGPSDKDTDDEWLVKRNAQIAAQRKAGRR